MCCGQDHISHYSLSHHAMSRLLTKRVYDVAGCYPKLKVFINGTRITVRSFDDYVRLYFPENGMCTGHLDGSEIWMDKKRRVRGDDCLVVELDLLHPPISLPHFPLLIPQRTSSSCPSSLASGGRWR